MQQRKKQQNRLDTGSTKKPLEISVSQLIAAYDANEIAADMHLKGRIISVAGVITDFGTEILGRKYVIIEDPNIPFYYVQCVSNVNIATDWLDIPKGM